MNLVWLLTLVFRSVLKECVGQTPPPGYRYASYEVVIPRRQTPRYGYEEPQNMNYLLQIGGKSHLVQLSQKRAFVHKHLPVFTYNKEGDLQVDYPFIRDDCFYNGSVKGRPRSFVAISICSGGLRGILQVENKTYEIEPVWESATFQHVVYQLEEEEGAIQMMCGLTEEEQRRQMSMIQNIQNVAVAESQDRPWWTHTMYAKLVIVVEHERYVQFGRNETVVALNILDVIHLANSLYVPLGIQISLVGLEIWSGRNLIQIANDIDTLLERFNTWRKNTLNTRIPHDAAHLFVYKRYGRTLGLAFTGTICSKDYASAVDSYTSSSLFFFTITFVHEQGHILGMRHDEVFCKCQQKDCIMAAYHADTDQFSNCSYDQYYTLMKFGTTQCLFDAGDPDQQYQFPYCGNKVVEHGEQCDCGSKLNCESDPCCQSNCTLPSGVTCAFGECCSKCQYLPAGTICRKSAGDCDLPEYCNGTSEWCPEDVYVQDGMPCHDGAYCYHGNCSTHQEQCKMIFGSRATAASEGCFRELNARGDRFGNCGMKGDTYHKCNARNILCGRIQCGNIGELPSLEEHSTIVQTRINNQLCWGTDYHHGIAIHDIGAVRDGTPCDEDMMCIGRECTNLSVLQYDCTRSKCHNRGMCNSHKHCHCRYGWRPPYCETKGYGGSIDSGPPPPRKGHAALIMGLLIPLAVLVIASSLGVYYRAHLMHWCRTFSASSHEQS